jgi:hypothetical protein
MKFNRIYFFIIVLLFISLLYSYYYFAKTSPNFLKLWGRIPDSKKNIYYISVLITLIGFFYFKERINNIEIVNLTDLATLTKQYLN